MRNDKSPRSSRVRRLAACLLLACLPPASTATPAALHTREVLLAGRNTEVDFHWPVTPPRGAVILAHGFTRSRATLTEHAAALAASGVLAVVPDLPFLTDPGGNARALEDLVAHVRAGHHGPAIASVVLVGFSAGGLAALLASATPGVVGYIGLDPFDRPGARPGLARARSLMTPVRLVRAPPSTCNAFGMAEPWVTVLPALEQDLIVADASHCDFEAPTDRLCQWACGATDPARQRVVREALLQAVSAWLPAARTATAGVGKGAQ